MDLNSHRVAMSSQLIGCVPVKSVDREHVQVVYTAVPTMSLKRCNSRVKRLAQLFIEYNHLF